MINMKYNSGLLDETKRDTELGGNAITSKRTLGTITFTTMAQPFSDSEQPLLAFYVALISHRHEGSNGLLVHKISLLFFLVVTSHGLHLVRLSSEFFSQSQFQQLITNSASNQQMKK